MIARIQKSMKENEQGFTLIELLVVMIIIGILAAIAIPVFLNQKKKAAETSAKSDATNIAKEVAAAVVDGWPLNADVLFAEDNSAGTATASSPLKMGPAASDSTPVNVGPGNKAALVYNQISASDGTYCVTVTPALAGTSAWSAGNKGLKKGVACP